jgi:DNA-directed RNA polymerase subunit RPC12/RpoP
MTQPAASAAHAFPCASCGARLEYAPGTDVLRCPYCGHEQKVPEVPGLAVREHAYTELRTMARKPVASLAAHVFVCQKCGAQTESDAIADRCQFCGAAMVAEIDATELIAPEGVLPFGLDTDAMRTALRGWVSSRWFAPSSLKKVSEAEQVKGTYLPHWTYDARTVSDYDGQRGEHYWTTETYTETVNGQTQTRTRQVQHTRWYPASGTVARDFDDVLVPATSHVTQEQLDKLTPWPLEQAVPYRPDYLAGYQALRYDTEPEAALEEAKARMAPVISDDCERDIGGDEQRVHSVATRYFDVTFKLLLLPVWIAAYLHAGKTYQVVINARTGEVSGQRPYSVPKIVAAVLAAAIVIALIVFLWLRTRH